MKPKHEVSPWWRCDKWIYIECKLCDKWFVDVMVTIKWMCIHVTLNIDEQVNDLVGLHTFFEDNHNILYLVSLSLLLGTNLNFSRIIIYHAPGLKPLSLPPTNLRELDSLPLSSLPLPPGMFFSPLFHMISSLFYLFGLLICISLAICVLKAWNIQHIFFSML